MKRELFEKDSGFTKHITVRSGGSKDTYHGVYVLFSECTIKIMDGYKTCEHAVYQDAFIKIKVMDKRNDKYAFKLFDAISAKSNEIFATNFHSDEGKYRLQCIVSDVMDEIK